MNSDLVSIIVPIYNVESYLENCLNSLLNQTYKNIEIILVNDGSTDNSAKIAMKYAMKTSRMHYYEKENGGLSDARNYGIKKSNGVFLCFVDSDDFVAEKFVKILYDSILFNDGDIAAVGFCYYYEGDILEEPVITTKVDVLDTKQAIIELFNEDKFCNFAWNKIYKRSLFNGISYPVGRKMEDLGTTYLLLERCRKIIYNPSKLYYYYQRNDSIMHALDAKFYKDKVELSIERFVFLSNKYPNMVENKLCMINTILTCYPYIEDNECKEHICQVMYSIGSEERKRLGFKQKIRYTIFNLNKKFYTFVFRKIEGNR